MSVVSIMLLSSIYAMDSGSGSQVNAALSTETMNTVLFPLHKAVAQGFIGEVRLLVNNNAALELRDDAGLTPLEVAFQAGLALPIRTAIASVLIEAGADMEVLDDEKSPLIFSLIKKVDFDGVALLLGYGASLASSDLSQRSPLAYALHKVEVSQNPNAKKIVALIQEYIHGKVPKYAKEIQTQAERVRLNVLSHQSVLEALKQQRALLREKVRTRKKELEYLQVVSQAESLRVQINKMRAELNL